MDMPEKSVPTQKDFKSLIDFLPIFCKPGFDPFLKSKDRNPKLQGDLLFKPAEYAPEVIDFFGLVSQDFWLDHDYMPEKAQKILENSDQVNSASFVTIQSLLTYCLRGERFCEGHWGTMINNGIIIMILKRLAEIAIDFE
jgi:hypothetical protein